MVNEGRKAEPLHPSGVVDAARDAIAWRCAAFGISAGTRQGGVEPRHVADLRVRRRGGGAAGIRPCHFANIAAANSDLKPRYASIAVPPFPLRGRVGPKGIRWCRRSAPRGGVPHHATAHFSNAYVRMVITKQTDALEWY